MDKLLRMLGKIFLVALIIVQLIPFYIVLTTSAKPKVDLSSKWIPPKSVFWDNFQNALSNWNILIAIRYSFIITSLSCVFIVLLGAFAAYPLARNKSKFNAGMMFAIVGVMMIPPLSTLVPLYAFMNRIHGVNTYWGIICIMVTGQLPLAIFLFKNFIATLPETFDEAAFMEGAGFFTIFIKIIIPLLQPVIASVIIITGTFVWNDYQMSLYMLPKRDMRNVATSVAQFFSQQSNNMGGAAAAALLGMLPIVILYLFLQKYFIKGMIDSAIK